MFFKKNKLKTKIEHNKTNNSNQLDFDNNIKSDDKKPRNEISNISENLHITGSIFSSGKISFNGSIQGTLETKSLYVGENGFIDGKVEADEAVILGRIKGTLKGNKVRLASSSRIEGDTYHQVIAIEDGAIYEGSIKRIKNS